LPNRGIHWLNRTVLQCGIQIAQLLQCVLTQ
jgi:hypothetical protein